MMKTKTIKLDEQVLCVFSTLACAGNQVVIVEKLDRDLYTRVNKALEALGGKWGRREKAHVFEGDASERIESAILHGEVVDVKKTFEFFETPAALVDQMIDYAEIEDGHRVLEPSAGRGAIVDGISREHLRPSVLHLVELDSVNRAVLTNRSDVQRGEVQLVGDDFMAFEPPDGLLYDRVVMNPPFSKQQDVAHVTRAFGMLKRGGLLVAIMSAGVEFRQDRKATEFRALVWAADGEIERLPADSFKTSGTGVNTVMVQMRQVIK